MVSKAGTRALAYTGVRAPTPPNITTHDDDPTVRDYFNYTIGDLWLNKGTISAPLQRVWMLVNQANYIATWVLLINGGGGPVVGLQPQISGVNNGAVVNPALGIINVNNTDTNIVPSNGGGNTLNIDFATNIRVVGTILSGVAGAGVITSFNSENNANYPLFRTIKRHNGGVVQLNDGLGEWQFLGSDGTNDISAAAITSNVTGAVTPGVGIAADLQLWTTAVGLTTQPRLIIGSEGNVLIPQPQSGINLTLRNTTLPGGLTIENSSVVATITATETFSRSRNGGPVQNGDYLGDIVFGGFDSASTGIATALIRAIVDGVVGANFVPTGLEFHTDANGPISLRFSITSSGNIVIQTPDSGLGLNVLGGGVSSLSSFTDVGNGSGIPLLVDNTGFFCTTASSIRYKENIKPLGDKSSSIMDLRPVQFNYKGKPKVEYGLIAEEVETVMPELVSHDKDGNIQSVKYNELIPLLLNEIQKLSTRINYLERECLK